MFRKEKIWKRSDVPRENPYTNQPSYLLPSLLFNFVGIVVCNSLGSRAAGLTWGDRDFNKAIRAKVFQAIRMALHNLMMTFLPMPLSSTNSLKG